jgi:hypothetical protein
VWVEMTNQVWEDDECTTPIYLKRTAVETGVEGLAPGWRTFSVTSDRGGLASVRVHADDGVVFCSCSVFREAVLCGHIFTTLSQHYRVGEKAFTDAVGAADLVISLTRSTRWLGESTRANASLALAAPPQALAPDAGAPLAPALPVGARPPLAPAGARPPLAPAGARPPLAQAGARPPLAPAGARPPLAPALPVGARPPLAPAGASPPPPQAGARPPPASGTGARGSPSKKRNQEAVEWIQSLADRYQKTQRRRRE